ncbi:hypothetical protein N7403_32265, partial [Pseudomonas nitroreducens]|uniref:hypothetical protein n=1 Tax=Pseudomonas nitroreducens TaxID=46680 RepID=UPI00244B2DD6
LSLQFVNAVKQLCKDFADRQDRPYMGNVFSALDALLVNEQIPVAQVGKVPDALREAVEYLDSNPFNEIGSGSILHRQMRDAIAGAPAQGGE